MKYCSTCGKELHDNAVICVNCGCQVSSIQTELSYNDVPSGFLNFLAVLSPLLGFIMYFTLKSNTPKRAKQIGLYALVAFALTLLVVIPWILSTLEVKPPA